MRSQAKPRRNAPPPVADKAPTGIAGLDETLRGGLPRGRTIVIFGGPGTGKTVFGLQSLVNGARRWNEAGIFVSFEENSQQIIANAATFGWDIPALQKEKLFFFDARLPSSAIKAGNFDLGGLLAALAAKVAELGAQRVVFDGIDVLLTLLDDPTAERAELFRVHQWLLKTRLTAILTAKAAGGDPFALAPYAFLAYQADCVMLLARGHQGFVSERDLSILKYRGSAFSENKSPFVIGPGGVEVAQQQASGEPVPASTKRLSTGVPRIDTMLQGGYFRGATALITGLPGTAKSSLCGAFVQAACHRREKTLVVSFDEHGDEIVRNLGSIGIRLQPFVDSGRLRIVSLLSHTDSAEIQLMRIRSTICEHRPSCVVVDPISALNKSSSPAVALSVLARFIHWVKVNGITLVFTSLLSSPDPQVEAAELGASTLSDTWIHLTYNQYGGERNRSLTIIKSRGTGHSNQVRELILTDRGIELADVYEVEGEVFMGTMRWEKENSRREEERRLQSEAEMKYFELERARVELLARRDVLERELRLNEIALKGRTKNESERLQRASRNRDVLRAQRGADKDGQPSPRRTTQRKREVARRKQRV